MEEWKAVEGTNGRYEVSNTGKVRSLICSDCGLIKELKPTMDNKGYLRVGLWGNGKRNQAKVHRLVAIAFIPNPENKPEVNHLDGNKTNNNVSNLQWATASENTLHAYKSGLKEKTRESCRKMGLTIGRFMLAESREKRKTPVIAIRISDNFKMEFSSQADASAATGVPQPNIHKVMNGQRRTAKGYIFAYGR